LPKPASNGRLMSMIRLKTLAMLKGKGYRSFS